MFSVKVPVLSEQITLTQPTVSAATSLRISAFDLASLSTFKVSDIAAVVGSPSGTAATIKTIASTKQSCTEKKLKLPESASLITDKIKAHAAAKEPIIVIFLPSLPSFSFSGAETRASSPRFLAILPSSASSPTAVTSIMPVPEETKVPEYAIFLRSASVAFLSAIAFLSFFTGKLSPVKVDSSTQSPALSISLPSAIILSPVSSKITSPATISSLGTTFTSPPRITFTLNLS